MRGGCELTNNALNAVDTVIINRVYRFNPIKHHQRCVCFIVGGFAPIFPDTCYHFTHYWPAAADIPV
ncbi:hypothetical protein, partial [Klebsiella pneumoniae]|uniref:hypothetical protein n=1 Tax=Klebsiella pneumoniae TaxID=573 RepID=UPI001C3CED63